MAMASVDEAKQRAQDAEEHRRIYAGIMKAGTEIGVPFVMALSMFFTQLTMRSGLGWAIVSFFVVYLLAWWVVRTFFSSH